MSTPSDTREDERWARVFVQEALAHPEAPEGMELYRWYWVPSSWGSFRAPVERTPDIAIDVAEVPARTFSEVVEVTPALWMRDLSPSREIGPLAAVGCDDSERLAVLFFANGGDLPDEATRVDAAVPDESLRKMTHDGYRIRTAESLIELRRMLDDFGLSEGEEWKGGTP